MNGKDLLDKMSDVDDKLIVGAEKAQKKKRGLFIGVTSGVATVAAAAAVAVVIGINSGVTPPPIESNPSDSTVIDNSNISTPSNSTDTPPIVLDPPELDFSAYSHLAKISLGYYGNGMAMGGAPERNIKFSELDSGSPWSESAKLTTMPVYMSRSTDPDLEKMYERVKAAAAALGISESELELSDTYEEVQASLDYHRKLMEEFGASQEEIDQTLDRIRRSMMSTTTVTGKANGIKIDLASDYRFGITFDPAIELPEGYNITDKASSKEKIDVLNYLADKYKDLLGYDKPTIKENKLLRNGHLSLYEADNQLDRHIASYWLNYTNFIDGYQENAGKLWKIWIFTDEGCDKIGDYPILTPEQAVAILKSNKYSEIERMPYDAKVLKTDIYYLNAAGVTGVLPYYRIYVESEESGTSGGEIMCDMYTIPAVPEQFIDIPLDDYGARA